VNPLGAVGHRFYLIFNSFSYVPVSISKFSFSVTVLFSKQSFHMNYHVLDTSRVVYMMVAPLFAIIGSLYRLIW
jgi:hypothetical protein